MNKVSIAVNNQVEACEAANYLGCAYSTIIALLAKKKLKGQKINGRWFVDFEDLQRAKSTKLIKTRVSKKQKERLLQQEVGTKHVFPINATKIVKDSGNGSGEKAELRFFIEKEKLNVLQIALKSVDKNLSDYVAEQVEDLHEKIKQSLKALRV